MERGRTTACARLSGALVLLVACCASGVHAQETVRAQEEAATDPLAPLHERGCVGCHSLDGSDAQGPSFRGLAGSHRGVVRAGERVTVVADADYLRRAIRDPDAEVVDGFQAGFMPRLALTDVEVDALAAAIVAVPPDVPATSTTWLPLALGLFVFVFGHLALSSSPFRTPLVARLGEGRFQGIYSLVATVGLGLVVWGYTRAPFVPMYEPAAWTRWIPNVAMPLAYVLLVLGFTTPSPTVAGMASRASAGPRGILRITRHPALWGFALWALAHIPPNGDLRSNLIFLGIAFLSFAGMVHIDQRRAAAPGDAWSRYERDTSVFPFAAIVGGRQTLALSELGLWRIALGLAAWVAMMFLHRLLIGVSPLP